VSTLGPTAARRPYPGLRPFRRDEADLFFGRDEAIDRLLDKLAETPLLAVLGTSGSGKSSLVRAGLLPALASGVLAGSGGDPDTPERWSVAELRPGERPFARLAAALVHGTPVGRIGGEPTAPGDAESAAALEADLRRGPRALNWRLGVAPLPPGERLLILVDQFEELFRIRQAEAGDADAFVALILAAASHPAVRVVVTLRSELLGDCARFPDLPEAIDAGLFLTPRLAPEQLADAVQLPARLPEFGGDVTPGLVRRLLAESAGEQDQLPLLQHCLMRLWDRAAPDADGRRVLDESRLDALGGLRRALSDHADEALNELPPARQAVAETLFRALTERGEGEGDTRRPVCVGEVAAVAGITPAEVVAVTLPFRRADRSFLMPPSDQPLDADSVVDIGHEALIRQWGRLRTWTAAESEDAELYRRLAGDARRWPERQAPWIDPALQLALDWRVRRRPTAAWAARYGGGFELAMAFLDAGRERREAEQAAAEALRRRELEHAGEIARIAREAALARGRDLFESRLTHAGLLARVEDYAAAWRVLGETVPLDGQIAPTRRHARNMMAGHVDIRHSAADRVYRGADAALIGLDLSPDGRWLVAGGERGTLVVFDAATGELVRRLEGHSPAAGNLGTVRAIRFAPNGTTLYSAGDDGRVLWRSVPDWRRQGEWQAPDEIRSTALSPNGTRLAIAGRDKRGIAICSTATGEIERFLTGRSSEIAEGNPLAFLPDGRLVAGGCKGQVGIWDLDNGEERLLPRIHTEGVNAIATSVSGALIASGSRDRSIVLWDAATGQPLRTLRGHWSLIPCLAFDATGRRLLSASYDKTLRLWDVVSATTLRVLLGHSAGLCCVLVRDGCAYTAANDGTLRRWPLGNAPRRPEQTPAPPYERAGVGAMAPAPAEWLWDVSSEPSAALVVPERGLLLVGCDDGTIEGLPMPAAEPPSGTPAVLFRSSDKHVDAVSRFALAPDGRTVATASLDGTARLWRLDGDRLTPLHLLALHAGSVHAVAFSQDGELLGTAGYDGRVGLFDVVGGKGSLTRVADVGRVASIAFAPAGNAVLTAHIEERRLVLWQRDGHCLSAPRTVARIANFPLWAALSQDGRRVAAVGHDCVVSVYAVDPAGEDATPHTAVSATEGPSARRPATAPLRLVGHEQTVYRAAFLPDAAQLATVSADMTLRIWDLDAAQPPSTDSVAEPEPGTDSWPSRPREPEPHAESPPAPTGQSAFTLRLPTEDRYPTPLWDFDLRCTADQSQCWIAVPLTVGRIALYRLPYADPPPGLAQTGFDEQRNRQ